MKKTATLGKKKTGAKFNRAGYSGRRCSRCSQRDLNFPLVLVYCVFTVGGYSESAVTFGDVLRGGKTAEGHSNLLTEFHSYKWVFYK